MNEHALQGQVVAYCLRMGIEVFQTDVMSGLQYFSHKDPRRFAFINHHKKMGYNNGQPDLVVMLDKGRTLFIELKRPDTKKLNPKTGNMNKVAGGKQSDDQKAFQVRAVKLGHTYILTDNLDDLIDYFHIVG